jgi:photosystem II stability/assembly factor-like uncharacterized protein
MSARCPCSAITFLTLTSASLTLTAYAAPPADAQLPAGSYMTERTPAPRDASGFSARPARRPADAQPRPADGGLRGNPNWFPFGPSGADAQSIAVSPTVPNLVLAGISNVFGGGGLYRSTDNGANWSLTTGTGNNGINKIVFASDGSAWAAAGLGGLFTSTDDGQTWTEVVIPASDPIIETVAVDPSNPSVVWVGLGQYFGGTSTQVLLRSTDGGVSWEDVSPPVTTGMGATVVAVDPANSQRVYAAFTGNFGIGNDLWYTTDGGVTWNEISAGINDNIINDIEYGPDGTVYIAGGQDFGSYFLGLVSTSDNGASWTDYSSFWPSRSARSVAIDPANPQHIIVGTTQAGAVRTTDGGTTWTYSTGGTGSYQVNDVAFVPGSSTVFLGMGSLAVFRSTDGGATYSSSAGGISSLELTSFAVNPLDPNEIAASYVGLNDGGIFISTDGGQTWTLSNAPLPRWQHVYFGPDGTLYGTHDGPFGRADDGLWRRNADGTWSRMGPGAPGAPWEDIGLAVAATPGPNPVILFGGYKNGSPWGARIWSFNRDGTGTWQLEHEGVFPFEQVNSLLWVGGSGPVALAGIVLFGVEGGSGQLLRSTDMGDTWNNSESGIPTGWNIWDINQGPQDDQTVYASASGNTGQFPAGIVKSTDGGQTWNLQGSNFTFRTFCVDPVEEGVIYGADPFNSAGPERSTDDGFSFAPFNTGFLPGRAVRDLVYGGVRNSQRWLLAATSSGGFATSLGGIPCPADWDGNGTVNSTDISAFLTAWLDSLNQGNLNADFDGNGTVNSSDISAFLTAWLEAVTVGC